MRVTKIKLCAENQWNCDWEWRGTGPDTPGTQGRVRAVLVGPQWWHQHIKGNVSLSLHTCTQQCPPSYPSTFSNLILIMALSLLWFQLLQPLRRLLFWPKILKKILFILSLWELLTETIFKKKRMYSSLHYFFLPPRRAWAFSWRWDSLTCPPFPHWRAALCCRECRAVLWGIWRAEQSRCHQCSQTPVFSAVGPKHKNKQRGPFKPESRLFFFF